MSFTDESRRAYCSNEHVRARILEFFGDAEHDAHSAMFLTVGTESGSLHREALPVEELSSWLDRGAEINRSLWDRESLICHLDVEYVNFDDHAYPFLNEERFCTPAAGRHRCGSSARVARHLPVEADDRPRLSSGLEDQPHFQRPSRNLPCSAICLLR